jgi:hypothetical protein
MVPIASAEIPPGTAYIRITSQVIKRDKSGVERITASSLYNKHISRYAIGNSVGRCVRIGNRRTLPRGTELCHFVFRMPLGQIVTAGVRSSEVYYRLAIVGGTGAYSNIGGHVQVTARQLIPRKEYLLFTVIGFPV